MEMVEGGLGALAAVEEAGLGQGGGALASGGGGGRWPPRVRVLERGR